MAKEPVPNHLSTGKRSVRAARNPVNGLVLGALLAVGLGHTQAAYAHGTAVEVTQTAVAVKAAFDDGEPMVDAQVLVYSPGDLETPWRKGTTDSEGMFLFAPDAEMPGAWEVTVRKAGHGETTTFLIDESGAAEGVGSSPTSPVQKWLSIAAAVWGFVGTALFFSRKPGPGKPTSSQSVSDQTSEQSSPDKSVNTSAAEKVPVGNAAGGPH